MSNDEPRWADRVIELRRERREKVIELRGEGMTQREIADALGVGLATVNADLTGETAVDSADESAAAEQLLAAAVAEENPVADLPQGHATPARTPRDLSTLRGGTAVDTVDDDDPHAIANRILARNDWRTR